MSVGNDDDLELEHANGLAGRYDSATIPNLSDTRINLIAGLSLNCWWLVAQFYVHVCLCEAAAALLLWFQFIITFAAMPVRRVTMIKCSSRASVIDRYERALMRND